MTEQWRDAAADQPPTDAELEAYYSRIATRQHIPTERCHKHDSILITRSHELRGGV